MASLETDAAAQEKMTYCFRLGPKEIHPPFDPVEASWFQDISSVPFFLSNHYIAEGRQSYPKAEKVLQDMFTMGWHMMNERARLLVVRRGFGIQKLACRSLEGLYYLWGKSDRAAEVKQYRIDLDFVSGVYLDLERQVLWRIRGDLGLQGPHPGDVFNLAENHQDPAVRHHATIVLGMVKLTCTSSGDKRYVAKLIEKKLKSSDPIEAEAARCAKVFDQKTIDRLN